MDEAPEMLLGLIQCSAAALRVPMQQPEGLARMSEIGTGRIENVAGSAEPSYVGLDLFQFIEAFSDFARSSTKSSDERPSLELIQQ